MLIDIIAGARPNFIKIAPIIDAITNSTDYKMNYRFIHTGQHYDKNMSGSFIKQLGIPNPYINFEVESGSHAEQTAKIMIAYEKILEEKLPDICIVVGDVNSTMACAIVAKKMCVKVAHVEGGIRSGDLTMPEEINRIVTDSISDFFFATTDLAVNNLKKSGVPGKNIFLVGNTMIDTLHKNRKNFYPPEIWKEKKLKKGTFIVLTLHRPSNVDNTSILKAIIGQILQNVKDLPVIFPVHPRTKKQIMKLQFLNKNLYLIDPLPYLEFNFLVEKSKAVITDSGGITEETSFLNIPCITLRDSTERSETITLGTNELIGTNPNNIKGVLQKLFNNKWKNAQKIPYWDGKTSKRIIKHLIKDIL
jgi:UDP-N-acetylglucosamine 2-epimerase (non-hydrolysing)